MPQEPEVAEEEAAGEEAAEEEGGGEDLNVLLDDAEVLIRHALMAIDTLVEAEVLPATARDHADKAWNIVLSKMEEEET